MRQAGGEVLQEEDGGAGVRVGGWAITSRQGPISSECVCLIGGVV